MAFKVARIFRNRKRQSRFGPNLACSSISFMLLLTSSPSSNRPFSSSPQPPFQSEAKSKVFVIKTIFIHIEIGTTGNYHNKNYALGLALKERLRETLLAILTMDDWPIKKVLPKLIITDQNCCTIKNHFLGKNIRIMTSIILLHRY